MPPLQMVHSELPSLEKWPGSHWKQAVRSLLPRSPAAQLVQLPLASPLYIPALQSEQLELAALADFPDSHTVHVMSPAEVARPGRHATQSLRDSFGTLPPAHTEATEEPSGAYSLTLQLVHALASLLENLPPGHRVHSPASSSEYVPPVHSSQRLPPAFECLPAIQPKHSCPPSSP